METLWILWLQKIKKKVKSKENCLSATKNLAESFLHSSSLSSFEKTCPANHKMALGDSALHRTRRQVFSSLQNCLFFQRYLFKISLCYLRINPEVIFQQVYIHFNQHYLKRKSYTLINGSSKCAKYNNCLTVIASC